MFNFFDLNCNGFLTPKKFIFGVRRAYPKGSVKYAKMVYDILDE